MTADRPGGRFGGAVLLLLVAILCGCGNGNAPANDEVGPGDLGDDRFVATEEDWRILHDKIRWARGQGLDTLPVGEAIAGLGRSFVGTPYVPRTLEIEGPERLVVNLRALDCVTFVETVLALVHVLHEEPEDGRWTRAEREAAYRRALRTIRYRDGVLNGYPSRLHYFSEWIRNGEEKQLVEDVTAALGGVRDTEPVAFMTSNPDAYRQLADSSVRAEIGRIESRLSREGRHFLPENSLEEAARGIRTGDIIAATSTVDGLDVAHTGFALRRNGTLHLMHAPLVGDSVQISERTLPRRIQEIEGQDGVLVARPLPPAP